MFASCVGFNFWDCLGLCYPKNKSKPTYFTIIEAFVDDLRLFG